MGADEGIDEGREPDGSSGGWGVDDDDSGFVVVRDPQRWMRSWRAARRDAERMRAALDGAGLGPVFGTVRADVDSAGDPVVILGGAADPANVARLVEILQARPARRVDGAA